MILNLEQSMYIKRRARITLFYITLIYSNDYLQVSDLKSAHAIKKEEGWV
jgi:hypothetical protein